MPHASVLALLLALQPASAGWHDASVNKLADFESFRAKHAGFVVLVYAPWCGHSRALLPEAEAAAKQTPGVPFLKVDGTEADAVATLLDVKGYPTLLFVTRGDGPPIEYEGARQAKAIASWAAAKSKPRVDTLAKPADVEGFVKGKRVALVLFAEAASAEAEALEAVSASAGEALPCALATADPASVSALSGLAPLAKPVLVAFTNHDEPLVLRPTDGAPLSHKAMLRFGRSARLPAVSTYAAGPIEEELFALDVPLHLLYFHAAPVGATPLAALKAAGKRLRGEALVATVDAKAHSEVAAYFDVAPTGTLTPPVLLGFSLVNGTKYRYDGVDKADADELIAFARSAVAGQVAVHVRSQPEKAASGPLVELVGSNFASVVHDATKDVLVQFYSPTCGHCKKLQPTYEAVAAKFADDEGMVVAQIDAVANDVPGVDPEGFPTIILYAKGDTRGVEYDGSRDSHDLVQFVADARAGRNFVGGLPSTDGAPDEDDGYRVEL